MDLGTIAAEYWVGAVLALISAILSTLLATALIAGFRWTRSRFKEVKKEQEVVKNGVQALLRDRIVQAYNHYQDKGYCPIYGLENVHGMFKEYTALGGNGAAKTLVEKLEQMPRTKEETQ